jgi:DNA-binding MarR family transcriptional regulator
MLLACIAGLAGEGGPVTVSRLAKRMRQTMPAISQKISGLEHGGYLVRAALPADRRVSCIALTEKGRKVSDDALRAFLSRIEQALNGLGDAGTEEFLALSRRLTAAMDQVLAETGPPKGGQAG